MAAFIRGFDAADAVTVTLDDNFTPLSLADIAVPEGRQLVGTGTLVRLGASGDVYNITDATVSGWREPAQSRGGRSHPHPDLHHGTKPAPNFGRRKPATSRCCGRPGGALENYRLHVQTSRTDVVSYGSGDVKEAPSNDRRLIVGESEGPGRAAGRLGGA